MPPLTQHIMTSQQSKCEGQPKEFQHPAQHQDLNVKRKNTDQFNCLLSLNFSYLINLSSGATKWSVTKQTDFGIDPI